MRMRDFLELTRLEPHNTLAAKGLVVPVDFSGEHRGERLNFVSHQWLGRKHPDPRGVHYAAIIAACDEMCKQKDVDPAKLYLWVDYVSVSAGVLSTP